MSARVNLIAAIAIAALPRIAHADTGIALDAAVAARAANDLPKGLGVVSVVAPPEQVSSINAIHIRWTVPPHAGGSTIAVEIDGNHKNARRRTVWASVRIAWKVQVVVARRALVIGERVNNDDVAIEERATDDRNLMVADALPIGSIVKRNVAVDEILHRSDVAVPEIPRGTAVRVIVRGRGLLIATQGSLERAARNGEPAIVRLAATQRVVHGRLTDPMTFELEGVVE